MSYAIYIHEPGSPEQLCWEKSTPPGLLRPEDVLLRHTAIGVNFIEIYQRNGLYSLPYLPCIPGSEGVGVIEAVGSDSLRHDIFDLSDITR